MRAHVHRSTRRRVRGRSVVIPGSIRSDSILIGTTAEPRPSASVQAFVRLRRTICRDRLHRHGVPPSPPRRSGVERAGIDRRGDRAPRCSRTSRRDSRLLTTAPSPAHQGDDRGGKQQHEHREQSDETPARAQTGRLEGDLHDVVATRELSGRSPARWCVRPEPTCRRRSCARPFCQSWRRTTGNASRSIEDDATRLEEIGGLHRFHLARVRQRRHLVGPAFDVRRVAEVRGPIHQCRPDDRQRGDVHGADEIRGPSRRGV